MNETNPDAVESDDATNTEGQDVADMLLNGKPIQRVRIVIDPNGLSDT